jgi:hypothetical protein
MFIAKGNFYLFGTGVKQNHIPSAGGAKVMKSEEKGTKQNKAALLLHPTQRPPGTIAHSKTKAGALPFRASELLNGFANFKKKGTTVA